MQNNLPQGPAGLCASVACRGYQVGNTVSLLPFRVIDHIRGDVCAHRVKSGTVFLVIMGENMQS